MIIDSTYSKSETNLTDTFRVTVMVQPFLPYRVRIPAAIRLPPYDVSGPRGGPFGTFWRFGEGLSVSSALAADAVFAGFEFAGPETEQSIF